MSTRPPLSPEMRALLDRERDIPALPPAQRARAMARARLAVATGDRSPKFSSIGRPRTRWAAAAAAALVASAAVGAAAYEIHARLARAAQAVPPPSVANIAVPSVPPPATQVPPAETAPLPAPAIAAPGLSPAEAARAEMRLLGQARAAVARGDFAAALIPIAEHARRFKNGRLTEEREALRVKSLAGLGRSEEARRAAAAFRARFPRSVLLPAVSRMPTSDP